MTYQDAPSPDRLTRRQQRTWRREASRYDAMIAKAERGMLAGTREWIGARAQGRVLEVAIGSGRSLPHYAPEIEVVGVDLSPEMLAIARERASSLGRPVELLVGDAEALDLPDEAFDTVVCALALCSIPRPAAALAQMHRVLRPGGALLLVDHIGSSWPPIYAGQWLVERVTIPLQGEHLTRRHLARVRAAGFVVTENERLALGMAERIHAVR